MLPATAGPAPCAALILEERSTDYNTDKLIAELAAIDRQDDPWFERLVSDPVGTRRRITRQSEVIATAKEIAVIAGLTPSQLVAFESMVDHDLQLIWGPAGDGQNALSGNGHSVPGGGPPAA